MESTRYAERRDRSRRHRSGKLKVSSVSARLNPDFDLKDTMKVDSNGLNGHIAKIPSNDELDPFGMNFDELVFLLQSSFVSDYLLKIYSYLKSDKNELCFPKIAPFKEAFLVKIAKDHSHLRCPKFNSDAKVLGTQILDVLEEKRDVFKWTHKYESGRISRNVLVYKKVYQNSPKDDDAAIFKTPYTPTSTTSTSLSSSMEELSIAPNSQLPHTREPRQEPTTAFKTNILNSTIKFIKDSTRLTYQFPPMLIYQAEYVYNLLKRSTENSDLGFGFKTLHSRLYDAMDVFREDYEFDIKFLKTDCAEIVRLALQKTPRVHSSTDSLNGNWRTSTLLDKSTDSTDSRSTKLQRDVDAKARIILALPKPFLKQTIEAVAEFVSDDARASLEFKDVSVAEFKFIEILRCVCRRPQYHALLSTAVSAAAVRGAARISHFWKVHMTVGPAGRRTGKRTVVMRKMPPDGQLNDSSDKMDTSRSDSRNASLSSMDSSMSSKPVKENVRVSQDVRCQKARPPPRPTSPEGKAPDPRPSERAVSKERRPCISFQSAGAESLDEMARRAAEYGHLPPRKTKLIEAMSTPMESDKGERMMRLMGWAGGALGLRGGITEPLMPALHISPGAGLGHVRIHPRQPHMFRRLILEAILSCIRSQEESISLSLTTAVTKREKRFIVQAVEDFNCGRCIELNVQEEMELVNRISEEMKEADDCSRNENVILFIELEVSKDKLVITLHKTQRTGTRTGKKRKRTKAKDSKMDNSEVNSTQDTTQLNIKNGTMSKSDKTQAMRVAFLETIRDFLTASEDSKLYGFDCILNTKHKAYISNVINCINKKDPGGKYNSLMENDIYKQIRRAARDVYVNVEFNTTNFALHKKYYVKRFTNSSLEPPKSKDVQNTIIYKNGKPTSLASLAIDDDDDDVIVVEPVYEVIVISDDDTDQDTAQSVDSTSERAMSIKTAESAITTDVSYKTAESNRPDTTSTSDVDSKSASDGNSKSTSDVNNIITSDVNSESISNVNCESTSDMNSKITSNVNNKSASEVNSKSISDVNSESISNVNRNSVSDVNSNSTSDVNCKSASDVNSNNDELVSCTDETDGFSRIAEKLPSGNFSPTTPPSGNSLPESSAEDSVEASELVLKYTQGTIDNSIENADDSICDGDLSLSIDVSNESLLLELLECANSTVNVKQENISFDSEFDRDVKALEDAISKCDIDIKIENNSDAIVSKDSSPPKLEINNNHKVIVDRNNLSVAIAKNVCENDSSQSTSKRSRSDSDNSIKFTRKHKKVDSSKYVSISPSSALEKINIDTVHKLQLLLSREIDKSTFLPLLKCHGVKNGGLVYSCHCEKSLSWLTKTVSVATDLTTSVIESFVDVRHKMRIRIHSQETVDKILYRLELYNSGLKTENWLVKDVQMNRDFMVVTIMVDSESFNYICCEHFSLYAGVDKAEFSVAWD